VAVHRDPAPDRDPARQRLTGPPLTPLHDTDDPARELRRVVERLAGLGPQRVGRAGADGVAPSARVRAVLALLAAQAADLRGDDHRTVPVLRPHALGDQLTVLVHEALEAGVDPSSVTARLTDLRRAL
jgi:hypothetical protein